MPPHHPSSSRVTVLAKDACGVFKYLPAYFSNSAIYSISYWKPWTLDILRAPLYILEFLSSDAEDCITKVIKEWEDKIDEVNTFRYFLLW